MVLKLYNDGYCNYGSVTFEKKEALDLMAAIVADDAEDIHGLHNVEGNCLG